MTEFQMLKAPYRRGWYWQTHDDGPMYGPHPTREDAEEDFWDDQGEEIYEDIKDEIAPNLMCSKKEWLASYDLIIEAETLAISTDLFCGDAVLERLEERNEEAVWCESPMTPPTPKAERELEKMLADALYRWCEKHDYWKEFRGLNLCQ